LIKQENKGVSAARNRGMAAARGRFFALLDSDDLWLPEKLEKQVSFFRSHPHALICQTEEIWIRKGVRINPKKKHKKPCGDIFIPSLALCLVSPSAAMMRRELIDEVGGFDPDLPACEDYDLWLRISRKYPVHLIDAFLTIKRGGHRDQLSRAAGLDRFRIAALRKLLENTPLTPEQHKAASEMMLKKCRVYSAGCIKRGRLEEAAYYEGLIRAYS
jgi:glycosyltransferase involved in cell wall biosynthesis